MATATATMAQDRQMRRQGQQASSDDLLLGVGVAGLAGGLILLLRKRPTAVAPAPTPRPAPAPPPAPAPAPPPPPPPPAAGPPAGCQAVYGVVTGDTLWSIAQRFFGNPQGWPSIYNANASLIEQVAQQNGFPSSEGGWWIFPGTQLCIPTSVSATAAAPCGLPPTFVVDPYPNAFPRHYELRDDPGWAAGLGEWYYITNPNEFLNEVAFRISEDTNAAGCPVSCPPNQLQAISPDFQRTSFPPAGSRVYVGSKRFGLCR